MAEGKSRATAEQLYKKGSMTLFIIASLSFSFFASAIVVGMIRAGRKQNPFDRSGCQRDVKSATHARPLTLPRRRNA